MKRDLDLIREILIAVEEKSGGAESAGLIWINLGLQNRLQNEVVFHINLLKEAGFLKLISSGNNFSGDEQHPIISRLTWDGYEFLDAARDEKRWKHAKEIAGKTGSFAFEILKPILAELAKQTVNSLFPGLNL